MRGEDTGVVEDTVRVVTRRRQGKRASDRHGRDRRERRSAALRCPVPVSPLARLRLEPPHALPQLLAHRLRERRAAAVGFREHLVDVELRLDELNLVLRVHLRGGNETQNTHMLGAV